jgi:DNA-binding response OmpR family regulator
MPAGGYFMADGAHRGMILVVDDNSSIRELAKVFLENAGYSVAMACDGAEGLRFYEQHQTDIMLLITDLTMPNMDGLELASRVLRIDSRQPVLVMSGESSEAYRGLESIAKPFRPDELVHAISRVLSKR